MEKISTNLQQNIDAIKSVFVDRQDLVCKEILCGKDRLCLMYVVGLIDMLQTSDFVVNPLFETECLPRENKLDYLKNEVLVFPEIEVLSDNKKVLDNLWTLC